MTIGFCGTAIAVATFNATVSTTVSPR